MDGPQFKVDEVIAKYIDLRDRKDKINADAKAAVKAVDANLDIIEAWLLNQANEQGVSSFACDIGTAFVKETDFANVSDWNLTLPFIQTHGLWQMLKKDVNKTAVKEFIDANGVPPPGVNWGSKREIQVRRKS
jgi:hypothetical protein